VYFTCFKPKSPSLIAVPIEYLGTYFIVKLADILYYPGPGLLLKEGALSGLLADNDFLGPSNPTISL